MAPIPKQDKPDYRQAVEKQLAVLYQKADEGIRGFGALAGGNVEPEMSEAEAILAAQMRTNKIHKMSEYLAAKGFDGKKPLVLDEKMIADLEVIELQAAANIARNTTAVELRNGKRHDITEEDRKNALKREGDFPLIELIDAMEKDKKAIPIGRLPQADVDPAGTFRPVLGQAIEQAATTGMAV